jgi:hypothetical protein
MFNPFKVIVLIIAAAHSGPVTHHYCPERPVTHLYCPELPCGPSPTLQNSLWPTTTDQSAPITYICCPEFPCDPPLLTKAPV